MIGPIKPWKDANFVIFTFFFGVFCAVAIGLAAVFGVAWFAYNHVQIVW